MDHQPFPHRLAKSRRLQIPKEHVQAMMHVFEASGWGLTGVGRRPVEKKKEPTDGPPRNHGFSCFLLFSTSPIAV